METVSIVFSGLIITFVVAKTTALIESLNDQIEVDKDKKTRILELKSDENDVEHIPQS